VFDQFTARGTVRADLPGSLWHLSGYRPCDERGLLDGNGLAFDLGCGADLRGRFGPASRCGWLTHRHGRACSGRVVVVTDAAGPGVR